jgi:hypothetical protein
VITRPDHYVDVDTYTGTTPNPLERSNFSFAPDFLWFKSRAGSRDHALFDTVRGRAQGLKSNGTDAQAASGATQDLVSFDNNGFTVGEIFRWSSTNRDESLVVWAWKAGGNKNTFNKDDVGYANASDVNMSVGSISSAVTNSAQTWSSNITTTGNSGNWYPSFPATFIFDADTSNYGHANGDGSVACVVTLSFSPAVTCNSNVTLYGGLTSTPAGGGGTISINGGTAVALTPCATTNPAATDATVVPFSGSISSIVITKTATGGEGLLIYGFEIDGIRLTDNTAFTIPAVPSIANTGASVGTKQGFSITTFTTPGSGTFTYSHGLTQPPNFIITKATNQSYTWTTYHVSAGATKYLVLNTTAAAAPGTMWDNTTPSSSIVFGNSSNFGTSTNYVTYQWHDVPGLQKFGSYEGNESTNGPFVELGFRPAILLVKNADEGSNDWKIYDGTRNPHNVVTQVLYPNSANDEDANTGVDFLSNGFKWRDSGSAQNGAETIIYAAWAEAPEFNLYGGQSNAR